MILQTVPTTSSRRPWVGEPIPLIHPIKGGTGDSEIQKVTEVFGAVPPCP